MRGENILTGAAICLPIAMTKDLYTGLNLDQPGFNRTEGKLAPQEESGDRLHVSPAEETARPEF